MRRKVMILGAGTFQLSAIKKAAAMGCYVITVDYLPDNAGHNFSHQYINCSTLDRECVLAAAEELQIDGICTFSSDIAVPTVGYINEKLCLPGVTLQSAEIMASKNRFREFLRHSDLDSPDFVIGSKFDGIEESVFKLKFPILFKPDDTSGSRGICRLNEPDMEKAQELFEHAKRFSRSGIVCVEELLEGIEVGGDGFLVNGCFAFIAITHKHMNGFIVTGHSLPSNISSIDKQRVKDALETCCNALGYNDGPLNFDVMVSTERVTIIEMSPRNGGNGIPMVIQYATDIDMEELTLRWTLGEHLEIPSHLDINRGCGTYVFGSKSAGILKSITNESDLKKSVPRILDIIYTKTTGMPVNSFEHNGDMIGYVLFECNNGDEYQQITKLIEGSLQMVVESLEAGE